jgi:vancomycin resistance protein YoaR
VSRLSPSLRWAIVGIAALFLLVAGGFGIARALGQEEILGDVRVEGVQLGGLTREEAIDALDVLEERIGSTPHRFVVAGTDTSLRPAEVGFRLDTDRIVDEAFTVGREGGVSDQFRWWLGAFFSKTEIPIDGTIDDDATAAVLDEWDISVVGDPPTPGGIEIDGTTPIPVYPVPGRQVDRDEAPTLILETVLGVRDQPTAVPVVDAASRVTRSEVDRAVNQAELWLSAPIRLRAAEAEVEFVFTPAQLADALRNEVVDGTRIELFFDVEVIDRILVAAREGLEQPPVDARFEVGEYDVEIVPGRPGTLIDPEETAQELARVASSTVRLGTLPFAEGVDPEVTTEDLEALGITHLVSQFTTYHSCCQNRVTNIHLFADTVTGAIVMPGETFSLNEHVGRRTTEKGYLEDGTIVQGELVETVGGGVSQFATTFYNAVFWGGYEDITHRPHSFYFSRYPEGIEATISWPVPELEFRNEDEQAVMIVTEYTDTSITVKFYGDNDGRIIVGEQSGGRTSIEVVEEGGPDSKVVSADVSGRFSFTEPEVEYRPNPELARGEQDEVQSPGQGWTVNVTRTITENGTETVEEWTVRYRARRQIIEMHPCDLAELEGVDVPGFQPPDDCPDPTTTTTSSSTTTTVPSSTTTTVPSSTTTTTAEGSTTTTTAP